MFFAIQHTAPLQGEVHQAGGKQTCLAQKQTHSSIEGNYVLFFFERKNSEIEML